MKCTLLLVFMAIAFVSCGEPSKGAHYDGQSSGPIYYPAMKLLCQQNGKLADYEEMVEYRRQADAIVQRANAETDGTKQAKILKELEALSDKNKETHMKLDRETRVFLHAIAATVAKKKGLIFISDYDGWVTGQPQNEFNKFAKTEKVMITQDIKDEIEMMGKK